MNRRCAIGLLLFAAALHAQPAGVLPGADLLLGDSIGLVRGRRVGLIVNQTSVLTTGAHLVDTLRASGVRIAALFAPEHGIRGAEAAGARIRSGIDSASGLPVRSLHGDETKPTPRMLDDVDILVYDLQDAGARFYTYISTLFFCMEAAAERNIPVVVLDRPDPIGGVEMEGPVLEMPLRSFVGTAPLPIRYGMTPGELARMIDGEGWLAGGRRCVLHVVPLTGWIRSASYTRTGLRWISPSPNMRSPATALVYPGTCLFEGTNISEGRGTDHPFEWIGAPFLDGRALAAALEQRRLPGVRFTPVEFTPAPVRHAAPAPRYRGERCSGVAIAVTDPERYRPVATALHILDAAIRLNPGRILFSPQFDILSGQRDLRGRILDGTPVERILADWEAGLEKFAGMRKRYLLYN